MKLTRAIQRSSRIATGLIEAKQNKPIRREFVIFRCPKAADGSHAGYLLRLFFYNTYYWYTRVFKKNIFSERFSSYEIAEKIS